MTSNWSIATLAKDAGIPADTVRYYLKRGLLEEPPRSQAGYRRFGQSAADRLRFILDAKALGFTLSEIKELIRLFHDPDVNCAGVKRRAEAKIADIDEKLEMLATMRARLADLAAKCPGRGPVENCPILGGGSK